MALQLIRHVSHTSRIRLQSRSGKCLVDCTVGCKASMKLCNLISYVCETCPINVDFDKYNDRKNNFIRFIKIHINREFSKCTDDATDVFVKISMKVENKESAQEDAPGNQTILKVN
ncbi:hypothetical protein LINPERHAP2_LOCUS13934 [Linum perenne]